MMRWWILVVLVALVVALLVVPRVLKPLRSIPEPEALGAMAELIDAQGQLIGIALLIEVPEGVLITLKVEGLPPGEHALHIHERGVCEPPDFASAGGHFNPFGKQHGLENPEGPHAGDLPNIEVGPDATAETEMTATRVTLKPGQPNSLLDEDGSALVIHAGPDDFKSDPAGNAGARIACGVIKPL
jgi:Cu-Zn family superoxide dismutase